MHPEDTNEVPVTDVIANIGAKEPTAGFPGVGCRKIVVEDVRHIFNNVGQKKLYIQYAYTHKGKTFRWALTYDTADTKLNKIFPNGVIRCSDIGKSIFVEIGYCNSKNGEYPSVLGLDDCGEQIE